MELLIESAGRVRAVYGEEIDLAELGVLRIRRGSHVEPTTGGQWEVDLGPVHGPRLGPYCRRSAALEAEVAWLRTHWLNGQTH